MHLSLPSFPKLALMLSVAGALTGFGISYLVTPSYVSEATLELFQTPGSTPGDLRPVLAGMQRQILSRTSLAYIIQDPRLDLYPSERRSTPLEDVIERMRSRDLRIGGLGTDSAGVDIRFAYRDPVKARDTVQTFITRFVQMNLQRQRNENDVNRTQRSRDKVDELDARIAVLEKRLGIPPSPAPQPEPFDRFAPGRVNIDVLDPPSLPINPVKPNRTMFAFFGLVAGIVMAVAIAIFRPRPHPAIPVPTVSA
jgi:hypothetical protein